jgi:L-lactate dehydrogenase complex protein LldF
MSQAQIRFQSESALKAFDLHHREIMSRSISLYDENVASGKEQFANLGLARRRAGLLKHFVIEHLEDHLKTFEQNFSHNGGQVIWTETAADARKAVIDILDHHKVRTVVKSKSMVTEEIGLNAALEKNGIECLETSLGQYILQLTNDEPYHMVTPLMHRTAKEIAGIFHDKFGLSENASPQEITSFVRNTLRKKFIKADAGITGANFLVADTGSVSITENEGNGILSMSMPRIHIVVTGIEKIIASVNDIELFWCLLATHGTGQKITAYNSLVNGPRRQDERDGPEYMYVVLTDNGRSRLLSSIPQRRSLACIRCGACLNACPVFRNIGGHAYGTTYTGPIGAVITPFLSGRFEEYKHLSFASTLCGKCTEVCPVGIDLHNQLIMNRRLSVKSGYSTKAERWAMWAYKFAMKKRSRLDRLSPKRKNYLFKRFLAKGWGDRRENPVVVKSFARQYFLNRKK